MSKIISYVDASVLISAGAKATSSTFARKMRALKIINDDERLFVGSEFLKLEVLPIATFFGKTREIELYKKFFSGIAEWVSSDVLISPALELASDIVSAQWTPFISAPLNIIKPSSYLQRSPQNRSIERTQIFHPFTMTNFNDPKRIQ